MKKFSYLISLFPCRSLEDFPVHGSKASAKSILAAWTGLWHPALIAKSETAPQWRPASDTVSSEAEAELHREKYVQEHYYDDDDYGDDYGEYEFDDEIFTERWRESLIVIPQSASAEVFAGFQDSASGVEATVVTDVTLRKDWLEKIGAESDIDPELTDDFFSLGYVRLQVEMMTQKLRYSSELDGERFDAIVVAAAKDAAAGNDEAARQGLQSAFDQLAEEKNRYYPVAADFVDMVLVSDSIRPESVDLEIESDSPKCFVMSGSAIKNLANRSEKTVKAIAEKVQDGSMCIVGGPENELPDNLLSIESILNQLKLGRSACEEHFESAPAVFMRRRFGLNASLPGILESLGFNGAVHATFDSGKVPKSSSDNMRWMGIDGSAIMAVGETPIDAASDKSFLDLGVRIGAALDSAHVSTVFLARWPTQTCDSFEDLKNSIKYGSVLGDFTDADSYYENAYDPGYGDTYEADEYESPWFAQAVASGSSRPVSTFTNYWRNWYRIAALRNVYAMYAMSAHNAEDFSLRLNELQQGIELQTLDWNSDVDESVAVDIEKLESDLLDKFDSDFINTVAWKRTAHVVQNRQNKDSGFWTGEGAIKSAACESDRLDAVVELSGFGQLSNGVVDKIEFTKASKEPLVDDGDRILRNEFFEVRIDRESGGIRGVHFYGKRGTLFSQRLAVRMVDPESKQVSYAKMVCDELELTTLSQIASQIRTTGKLVGSDGTTLAKYVQTVGLQRGRNVIDLEIKLSDIQPLDGSTKNYIANRIAWSDESAELFCDIQGARHPVRQPSIEAPHFVEVVQGENRFALLSHGLPWHRRATKKMLDSVLVVGNESQRNFKLGVVINPQCSMQSAVSEMHPVFSGRQSDQQKLESSDESNWLFHLANRNIIATWCSPVFDDDCRCVGMRVRLQEIEGREGQLKLYCRQKIESIGIESFDDQPVRDVPLHEKDDASDYHLIKTSFAAFEFFQLCIRWSNVQ